MKTHDKKILKLNNLKIEQAQKVFGSGGAEWVGYGIASGLLISYTGFAG